MVIKIPYTQGCCKIEIVVAKQLEKCPSHDKYLISLIVSLIPFWAKMDYKMDHLCLSVNLEQTRSSK